VGGWLLCAEAGGGVRRGGPLRREATHSHTHSARGTCWPGFCGCAFVRGFGGGISLLQARGCVGSRWGWVDGGGGLVVCVGCLLRALTSRGVMRPVRGAGVGTVSKMVSCAVEALTLPTRSGGRGPAGARPRAGAEPPAPAAGSCYVLNTLSGSGGGGQSGGWGVRRRRALARRRPHPPPVGPQALRTA
jgi:hypothetical protein